MARAMPAYVWLPDTESSQVDSHAGFRLCFATATPNSTVVVRHVAISWYNLFLDGHQIAEGPTRFVGKTPYYDTTEALVPVAGKHVLAVHVHSCGVSTRLLNVFAASLCCDLHCTPAAASVSRWRCSALSGYSAQWRRLSPLLGWAECRTLADSGADSWRETEFDDSAWVEPVALAAAKLALSPPVPLLASGATSVLGAMPLIAEGDLVERFGYPDDEPPVRFSLRQLSTAGGLDYGAPQGRWFRFDVGRCRLLRPSLRICAPAGTTVEIVYAQALIDGRTLPFHPLTGGATCYMDRYTLTAAAGGDAAPFALQPLEPRGCRFVEVHALLDDDGGDGVASIRLVSAAALFRAYEAYHPEPTGSFSCPSDKLLERIWRVGVDTTRSCVEDTAVDGPCRERGAWTGDTLAVTLPNLACTYDDLRPVCVALLQSSEECDAHGVVSGMTPNFSGIVDYALIWFTGAAQYYRSTGDAATMRILLPRATKCMDYFLSPSCYDGGEGFAPKGYSSVIDWGYTAAPGWKVDLCLNALLVSALSSLASWCAAAGEAALAQKYATARDEQVATLRSIVGLDFDVSSTSLDEWVLVEARSSSAGFEPSALGFHAAALLLRAGVLDGNLLSEQRGALVAYLETTLNSMFPMDRSAPRLNDPSKRSPTGAFYTPYFQTFAFEGLFAAGECDFVLEQYRGAWGWALTQSPTWLEVFDVRWEAVHSWGGCPTWQLSRFLLGLVPRFDLGARHFELDVHCGQELLSCSGVVPARGGTAPVTVSWTRGGASGRVTLTLESREALCVRGWPGAQPGAWVALEAGAHTATLQDVA